MDPYWFLPCAALANALLPQMDASFKAAVTIVSGMQGLAANEPPPLTTTLAEAAAKEEALVSILSSSCSLLIAVPGHPDHGPFHMATGLLNIFHSCHWRRPASLPTLHLRMLSVFNAYAQPTLPYRAPGVDANDVLYAAEPEYADKLTEVCGLVLLQVDAPPASYLPPPTSYLLPPKPYFPPPASYLPPTSYLPTSHLLFLPPPSRPARPELLDL